VAAPADPPLSLLCYNRPANDLIVEDERELEALKADDTTALEEAERRHREALDALVALRAEYEEARRRWQSEKDEAVAMVAEVARQRLEAARQEHEDDLQVLRDEQGEAVAAFEKEKREAVWRAKQEVQARYEEQLSGMLRVAEEARKAALEEAAATKEGEVAELARELERERDAHELTRERLQSKETEIEQVRTAAERARAELEEAEARGREDVEALERRHAEALTAIQQKEFFRAAAFAKAFQDSGNSERLRELIEEFVREVSS
jgi:chromosome segregation ATPase